MRTHIWKPWVKEGWDELGHWDWHRYAIDTMHKTDN